jgi:hypothetical protein
MGTLLSNTSKASLVLRPHKVAERGRPAWITAYLEIRADTLEPEIQTAISLTDDDLNDIYAAVTRAVDSAQESSISSTDEDFIFETKSALRPEDVAIRIWTGEAYGFKRGYCFIASRLELVKFARMLKDEVQTVLAA